MDAGCADVTELSALAHDRTNQPQAVKHEAPILTLADDGLATAIARMHNQEFELTIDNSARFSIVGSRMKQFSERLRRQPRVTQV